MPILELQLNNAPILRQKAAPIERIDAKLIQLIRDMFETMYDAEGIGLAAPQVGVSQRVIVVDIEAQAPQIPPLALINPVITNAEGEDLAEEGCLSLPEQTGMVRRAIDITVKGVLPNGKAVAFEANSLLARVLQHEIDHLDGILFIDRLIPEDQVLLEERGKRMNSYNKSTNSSD